MSIQNNSDIHDPWVLTSAGAALQMPERSTLTVTVMQGITPLDGQIGAVPKKTVPDALRDLLFGQDHDAASLRTYAVLDAARLPYLLTGLLENSGMRHECLFQGRALDELGEHAPYLVELRLDAELTQRLFTGKAGINGLWPRELGIYIRSRLEFDALRRHLRKFTRVRDEAGQWFYFAFWDPGSLGWLARHGPRTFPDHLARAGAIHEIFAFSDDAHVRITQPAQHGASDAAPPFVMDAPTWATLGQFVERRFLVKLANGAFATMAAFADARKTAVQQRSARAYDVAGNHCFTFAMEVAAAAGVRTLDARSAPKLDVQLRGGNPFTRGVVGTLAPEFEVPARQMRALQQSYRPFNASADGAVAAGFQYPTGLNSR